LQEALQAVEAARMSDYIELRVSEISRQSRRYAVTKNFLMVQAPAFIRGINPKSKIENPQAPAFIRGVASKI
jgi:hypothetical protein